MARILIIGIGNSLRSDDGVGWQVGSELSGQQLAADVEVIVVQQLTPEIAEPISRAEKVLFVDAVESGKPGTLRAERILPATESRLDSHQLMPSSVLKMALDFYGKCPQAFLLTVVGESFGPGQNFSAAVSSALPAVRGSIERFLSWARKDDCIDAEFLDDLID